MNINNSRLDRRLRLKIALLAIPGLLVAWIFVLCIFNGSIFLCFIASFLTMAYVIRRSAAEAHSATEALRTVGEWEVLWPIFSILLVLGAAFLACLEDVDSYPGFSIGGISLIPAYFLQDAAVIGCSLALTLMPILISKNNWMRAALRSQDRPSEAVNPCRPMTRWSYGAVFLVVQPLITVVCFCLVGKFLCDMEILEYHGLPPYHPVTLRGQLGDFGVLVEDVFWGHPLRVGIFALAASVVAEAALLSLRKLKILGHGYGSYLGIVIGYVWLPIFGTWLFLKWILVDPTLGIDIDGNDFVLLLSLSAGQLVPSLWTSHALCSMVAMTNGNPRQPTGSHLNI